jgi:hypothetical protein
MLIKDNLPDVLKRFYDTPLKYTGTIAWLLSTLALVRKKHWIALACFFIPFICFVILLLKTGASIVGDHYYVLTIIPAMAFIIGLGLDFIANKKIVAVLLLIIAAENIGNQVHDFQIREPLKALTGLETIMDNISQRTDLVAINADVDNPTAMYFAHRRGWVTSNETIAKPEFQDQIRSKGCKYIVIARKLYGDPPIALDIVYESDEFKIYQLAYEQ